MGDYMRFTVGPSELYPTVRGHIDEIFDSGILSDSHRGSSFHEMMKKTVASLRDLLSIPDSHEIFFVASGTEAMERTIKNCAEKETFHFINGVFSKRAATIAEGLGKKTHTAEVAHGEACTDVSVVPESAELVTVAQNETSTGVWTDLEPIYGLYDKHLIAVDGVSSMPYGKINFEKVDVLYFSVQKGFGLPAGLGVMVVGPRALEKSQKITSSNSFRNFAAMKKQADKFQTEETPNVLLISLLGRIARDMHARGTETIRQEIDEKKKLLDSAFPDDAFAVSNPSLRSPMVIVVKAPNGSADAIKKLGEQGYEVSTGYGDQKESHIRIANFPSSSVEDMKKLIQALKSTGVVL